MTGLLMQKIQFARLHIDSENAHHLSLRDVVIHSAVMLTHKRQEGFLQPFVRLINVPSTMQVGDIISVSCSTCVRMCCVCEISSHTIKAVVACSRLT